MKKNSFLFLYFRRKTKEEQGFFHTFLLCFRSQEKDRIEKVFLEIELSGRKEKNFFKKNHIFLSLLFFLLLYFRRKTKKEHDLLFDLERRIDSKDFF